MTDDSALAVSEYSRRFLLGGAATIGLVGLLSTVSKAAPAWAADVPFPLYDPWSGVGLTRSWALHNNGGLDINVPQGRDMKAPAAGSIQRSYDAAVGRTVVISHPQGWKSVFFHLQDFDAPNGPIDMGALFAQSGGDNDTPEHRYSSGSVSTGPHVHWHLEDPGGVRRNPRSYINATSPTTVIDDPILEGSSTMAVLRVKNFSMPAAPADPLTGSPAHGVLSVGTYTLFTEYEVYEVPEADKDVFKKHYSPNADLRELGVERHVVLTDMVRYRRQQLLDEIAARVVAALPA